MPMTIEEVSLVKYDSETTADGTTLAIEIDVEFSGEYDPIAAKNLTTVTPTGLGEMLLTAGSEVGTDSGIYVRRRAARLGTLASGGAHGMFTLVVSADDAIGGNIDEDPLARLDTIVVRRGIETVPISRDRTGRLIATYRRADSIEDDLAAAFFGDKSDAKPIEVFASMPTVPAERLIATITGYRSKYMLALETLDEADPNAATEQPCIVVNDAPIEIAGITWKKGMVALLPCTAQPVIISGVEVIAHTWEVAMNPLGWNLKILNAGTWDYDESRPSGEELQVIPDRGNRNIPTTVPLPLDAEGKALPVDYAVSDLVYLNFITTRPANFSSFNWNF